MSLSSSRRRRSRRRCRIQYKLTKTDNNALLQFASLVSLLGVVSDLVVASNESFVTKVNAVGMFVVVALVVFVAIVIVVVVVVFVDTN